MLPLLRQLTIAMSTQLAALSLGGSLVYPTQLIQQLKSNDSTIQLDIHTSSWIGSIYGLAGIPVIFLPMLMQWRGRKFVYIITCTFVITGWALSLTANSTTMILLSETFQGLGTNSLMPVSCLSMTEMLAPKYRFCCMQLFSVSISIGMVIVGISGRFIHFKTISLIMLVPIIIAMLISFVWSESPPWLACKGEFDKCARAFLKLRGSDEASTTELSELITAQRENLARVEHKTNISLRSFWSTITRRDFYMPAFHIFVLMNMMYMSGGNVVMIYFFELVEKTTQNQKAIFYAGIALYAINSTGCIITNFAVGRFKNKTILLFSASGIILCLICSCVVTFLQSIEVLPKDSLLCMCCLLGYIIFYSLGMNSLVILIGAELMPVKHRSIGGAIYMIFNCGLYAFTLKISPYLIIHIGVWGLFCIFTINAMICALYVWKYIPETKSKTLQELEDFYMYGKFIKRVVDKETLGLSTETLP